MSYALTQPQHGQTLDMRSEPASVVAKFSREAEQQWGLPLEQGPQRIPRNKHNSCVAVRPHVRQRGLFVERGNQRNRVSRWHVTQDEATSRRLRQAVLERTGLPS